jgi:putative DNA primase/helicase
MQVPIDYAAVTALIALAVACGRRASIQPKALDSSWTVTPNLWGGIVGAPGALKSAVMAAIFAPLNKIEDEWHSEHEAAARAFNDKAEKDKINQKVWSDKYERAQKTGTNVPDSPECLAGLPPTPKRIMSTDPSFEKLQELMRDNPAGISIVRDELAGFLQDLSRPGHESYRSAYLETWSGDTRANPDRITRGSVWVPHCCVSIMGSIQPGPIRSYLANELRGGSSADGFFQRFQVMVWPDISSDWSYIDIPPNALAQAAAADVYRGIVQLDPNEPLIFRFDDHAQAIFVEWYTLNQTRQRDDSESDLMQSHLAKYASLMPSIALLLALADGATEIVDSMHAQQAVDWCDYLESHTRRIYDSQASPEKLAAVTVSLRLRGMWAKGKHSFSLRDVYRQGWTGVGTKEQARAALQVLEAAGWVMQVPQQATKVGRPSETYLINPRIGGRNA